jgi:hypothetical protein
MMCEHIILGDWQKEKPIETWLHDPSRYIQDKVKDTSVDNYFIIISSFVNFSLLAPFSLIKKAWKHSSNLLNQIVT